MKNINKLPEIKAFNKAKKQAVKDIKNKDFFVPLVLFKDDVLFNLTKPTLKPIITKFDSNIISASEINKFHQLIQ